MLPLQTVQERVNACFDETLELLKAKIACAAVSAQGTSTEHMKASADMVANALKEVGIDTKVIQSTYPDGTPGAWEVVGERIVDDNAPTVLLYAHHDVQPVPDKNEWRTDPFSGTVVDGRLYGRGAADDGGGIAIHYGSLRALDKDCPVNIKVFIEGEEEVGSPTFISFIEDHREEFASDVIIVADSGNWSEDIPSLTTSLRGNTCLDVELSVLGHPVHSGQFGGPILDAHTLLAMLVSSMYDKQGNLLVEGLLAEEPIGGLEGDIDETTFRQDAAVAEGYALAGSGTLASRLWTKPSITVIGWDAHCVDESFNVIAERAKLRLSVRTSPRQRPQEAQQALAAFLVEHAPLGAHVEVTPVDNGMGWAMDMDSPVAEAALDSMRDAFGIEPKNKGEGGSIPFIPELQRIFPQAKVLVTGPEDPKSNAHSPNESIHLEQLRRNIVAQALLLERLGEKTRNEI